MISFKDVSFTYGGAENALLNINLHIEKGETVLLCGESGCGKTTITRLINGLIPQYYKGELKGTVSVGGMNPAETPLYDMAETVGSVFQNPKSQFFNVDTTSELAFACENMGMPEETIRERMKTAAEKLRMEHLLGRSIFDLSGGEKQKIACGGISMLSPQCVVMDEPTSNLDIPCIHMLKDVMSYWKSQGKTIVIAEHRLWFLRDIADRVIYLKKGRIAEEYTGKEFFGMDESFFKERGLRSAGNCCPHFEKQKTSGEFLTVDKLDYSYKNGRNALNIPRLQIPAGQVTAIAGHNGAGKSTLVSCLCGLNKHDKSVLTFKGRTYSRKKRMSLCFPVMQDVNHQLFTESVLDEVLLSMKNEDMEKAMEILKAMDLEMYADAHPMSLSGGQKQRVAIASALASEREILILDEPTSGLDLKHMQQVAERIRELKAMGKTVLVVTHDAELIGCCCDTIISLDRGCLTEYDEALFA